MASARWLFVGLILFTSNVFALNSAEPNWKNGDTTCPQASATDRYIDVPVFYDLAKVAKIDRIPGLNVYTDLQKQYQGKQLHIYYEIFRPWDPNKKLLILVPGGPGQPHADLHSLVDIFEKRTDLLNKFNVISMDHRGVGCSRPLFPGNEPAEALTMRQAASDIESIRRQLVGASGQITVFGYSYGSILSQTYALLYPDNIERLFLGGAASSPEDFHLAALELESFIFSAVTPVARQQLNDVLKDDPLLKDKFVDWAFAQLYSYTGRVKHIPEKIDEILKRFSNGEKSEISQELASLPDVMPWMTRSLACIEIFPYTTKYAGESTVWARYMSTCREFEGRHEYFNYTPLLKQISTPTMVFGGAFDHVTPAKGAIQIGQQIPGSFVFIDNYMGHGLNEHVDCFLKLSSEFMSGASRDQMTETAYSETCQAVPKLDLSSH